MSSRPRPPAEARRSNSDSCGNRFISTSQSTGVPLPPSEKHPSDSAGDRDDPAIEVRGRPPVESQFRLTKRAAPFARGEIEIVEPDGSFQLVRTGTREKDDGGVRVDPLDGRTAMRGWRPKEVDDGCLIFRNHDFPTLCWPT